MKVLKRGARESGMLLVMILVTGCFHLKPGQEVLRQHAVFVHSNGRAVRPQTKAEQRQAPAPKVFTEEETEAYIQGIIAGLRASGKKDILVFTHGGLISLGMARDLSAELRAPIDSAGYYPIFIDWDAAWYSAVREHLLVVRQGEAMKPVPGFVTFPFVLLADVGRGVTRLPSNVYQQMADYCVAAGGCFLPRWRDQRLVRDSSALLYEHAVVQQRVQAQQVKQMRADALAPRRVARPTDPPVPGDDIEIAYGEYRPGAASRVIRFGVGVVTFVPKLVTGPIVDGFGSGTWDILVRRTRIMIRRDDELKVIPRTGGESYAPPRGVVARLMQALAAEVARDTAYRTVLVGHSMGAIVTGNILRGWGADLNVTRVVYMAAASSLAEVEASVVPFLRREPSAHFYNLTLSPYTDAREWNFLDLIPRGSLLEWLDDYLTNPETRIDRRAGKWSNVIQVQHTYPADVRTRMHIKAFGYKDDHDAGTRFHRKPSKHGHFSDADMRFWLHDMIAVPVTPPVERRPGG